MVNSFRFTGDADLITTDQAEFTQNDSQVSVGIQKNIVTDEETRQKNVEIKMQQEEGHNYNRDKWKRAWTLEDQCQRTGKLKTSEVWKKSWTGCEITLMMLQDQKVEVMSLYMRIPVYT